MAIPQALVGVLAGFLVACSNAPGPESADAFEPASDSGAPVAQHDGARPPHKQDAGPLPSPQPSEPADSSVPTSDATTTPEPTFLGAWTVDRSSDSPCLDGQGAPRELDAQGEHWVISSDGVSTPGKLGVLTARTSAGVLSLSRGQVTGSVTLTDAHSFAGTLHIRGRSPVPPDGWADCTTVQTVVGVRL